MGVASRPVLYSMISGVPLLLGGILYDWLYQKKGGSDGTEGSL